MKFDTMVHLFDDVIHNPSKNVLFLGGIYILILIPALDLDVID